MSTRLRIVNCADIVEPGWDFLRGPLADMPLDWRFFSAAPQSRLERRIKKPNLARWRASWEAARSAAQDPDCVIVSHLPKMTLWTAIFCRLLSVKAKHIAFAFNFTDLPVGLHKALMRWAFQNVDRFVVFSNAERKRYAEYFNIDARRIDFLPWVMEVPRSSGPVVISGSYICAVGGEGRDYDTLVEAVRHSPHIKTVIVTRAYNVPRGPLPKNLVVHTELRGPEFWNVVKHSHFVVLPLRDDETCCGHITLVGALQLGRPIVASQSRGIADYVMPGVNALIVKAGDPRALAQEIERLWSDQHLHGRLHNAIIEAHRDGQHKAAWTDYFRGFFGSMIADPGRGYRPT